MVDKANVLECSRLWREVRNRAAESKRWVSSCLPSALLALSGGSRGAKGLPRCGAGLHASRRYGSRAVVELAVRSTVHSSCSSVSPRYIDNACMQVIQKPSFFDVVATGTAREVLRRCHESRA